MGARNKFVGLAGAAWTVVVRETLQIDDGLLGAKTPALRIPRARRRRPRAFMRVFRQRPSRPGRDPIGDFLRDLPDDRWQ